jgi:hypothetical protein
MDSIDKLLAEIEAEYKAEIPQPPVNTPKPAIISVSNSDASIGNLLAEIQAEFAEQDAIEELRKKQELEEARVRQAQVKAKQVENLQKQAQAWLSKLDSLSSEGIWFESFSKAYPSKLDAAIEYLQNNS